MRSALRLANRGRAAFRCLSCLLLPASLLVTLLLASAPASANGAEATWTVHAVATPSGFAAGDALACELEGKCDRYQLLVINAGDAASSSTEAVKIKDTLPAEITTLRSPESESVFNEQGEEEAWHCRPGGAGQTMVICELERENFEGETFPVSVAPGHYALSLSIVVSAPKASMAGTLTNEVQVEGGGAPTTASTSEKTAVNGPAFTFGLSEFMVEPEEEDGTPAPVAGGHPWDLTTRLGVPASLSPRGEESRPYAPVENLKSVSVELPLGFVGNPRAAPECTQVELEEEEKCPQGSQVGLFAVIGGGFETGAFVFSQDPGASQCCSAVYNMVPESGYPAEFGFTFLHNPVAMYASVVHTAAGYRTRITVPSIPSLLETSNTVVTFFGEPGALNGSGSDAAFLSNPADCSAGATALSGLAEVESYGSEGHPVSGSASAYSGLTGCGVLHFAPTLGLAPSASAEGGTTQVDEPSAFSVDLKIPQTTKFSEAATPPLRDATITLPEGVSISPPAGEGLTGCLATGREGINIGSDEIGPGGRDLGNAEATELGAGHPGGDESSYDDGFYHTASGHCPGASTLGTAEVFTPLLPDRCGEAGEAACKSGESPAPLQGHVYLAQPKCGGAGQSACTEASATNGELYGLYLELSGDGVIVKLPGTVEANPRTGQLTASFTENPQLPFEELKLHLHGGPRAPLANPQTCGSFSADSRLTSWAGQVVSQASGPFGIDWDGHGGACPATLPFRPAFSSGTTNPVAGAYSPFVLQLTRQDGEQDLSGLDATLPEGLLAKLAGVPECGEAQANAGTCPEASQMGTVTVTAGAGSEPLEETGKIYLTGPYNNGPFGESVVIPAVAGPFNLGDVVVRGSIRIDPNTARASIVSNPFPTVVDGVPVRVRSIDVDVNRPGFTFNPTDCDSKAVTGTVTAAQGASEAVSSPFAVTGCANLPFKPLFKSSTRAKTSRVDGASLVVKVAQKPGEANIHRVHLAFPKALPARLSTLRGACTEVQFAANPSGCPAGSVIGTGTAVTPVLSAPLSGPAYLVSHGGAAYPDVVFVLQGDGVTIDLTGATDIKKGIAYSTFETVPDAPVTSFETVLPEGPHAIFAANLPAKAKGSFCGRSPAIATTLEGQNGGVVHQNTKIKVIGCPKKHTHGPKKKGGKHKK